MSAIQAIREAIVEALPIETSSHGAEPEQRHMYVPSAHLKALRLECNLVVGARGVGKSFWTAALGSAALRSVLGHSVTELEKTDVRIGFSVASDLETHPNGDVFAQLMEEGAKPYDVWRAVLARWFAGAVGEPMRQQSWKETVGWVRSDPEAFGNLARNANAQLDQQGRYGLVVFDALDRTSSDWQTMDGIVRDLLRLVLWLKSFSRLHGKVFLREDQFDRTITDFPDASKLLSTRADLTWALHDLHGLLWQMLCNAPDRHGDCLRVVYEKIVGVLPVSSDRVWHLADEIKRESGKQRMLFESLAGSWMGRDPRRGVPYVWAVSHLADGRGRTSPRSFLAAIRAAAEDSREKYSHHQHPLHFESIKRGVQKASEIRVAEMAEDYPWVTLLMEPLRGLTVPCDFTSIEEHWNQQFPTGPQSQSSNRLPPQHLERGWPGVRTDLERLGIFETKKDGRINMPDLYRVGFGLGRRGGVKASEANR